MRSDARDRLNLDPLDLDPTAWDVRPDQAARGSPEKLAGDGVRGGGASASTFPALKRGPEKSGSYQNDAEEMARSMARRRRQKTSPFLVGVEDGGDGLGSKTVSAFGCEIEQARGLNGCARGWGSEGEPRWRSRSSVLTALVQKSGGNGDDGELDSEQPDGGGVGFLGGFGGGLAGFK